MRIPERFSFFLAAAVVVCLALLFRQLRLRAAVIPPSRQLRRSRIPRKKFGRMTMWSA